MSVYLVAGGAGFIGTNFVSYLRSRHPGDTVVVVDYLGFASNLDNLAQPGDVLAAFCVPAFRRYSREAGC